MKLDQIIKLISAYHPTQMAKTPHSAAVLVLIVHDDDENLFLIVTKRTDTLATYAGDYSFPGGMRDPDDADLKQTMHREVREELSLTPDCYQVIGQLDDFIARYGNLVRPFVATMDKKNFATYAKQSETEVASIYYFPLSDLAKITTSAELEIITKRHPAYVYTQGEVTIWGLTASIIVLFGNIILQLDKSVGKNIKPGL